MKNKKIEIPTVSNSDLQVRIIKDWQHPAGSLKKQGQILTVTNEFGSELIADGIAEMASNPIKKETTNNNK